MNILFYLYRFPAFGGIETVTRLITEELFNTYGVHITILSFAHQDSFSVMDGIVLKRMPNSEKMLSKENYNYAEQIIQNGDFDYIIYQDCYANIEKIICELACKYKVKLYTFEHNTPLIVFKSSISHSFFSYLGVKERFFKIYGIVKSIKRRRYLLRFSDKYVLLSRRFIPEFAKSACVSTENSKFAFINNPIKLCDNSDVCRKENIILCVCQLVSAKSVNLMIELWGKIHQLLPDWKFQIVGDGKERLTLEKRVLDNCIPRVEFVGFANPFEYYNRAKVFWMMSRYEGWGMTLVEAQQLGCIPIAYNTYSSVFDIITDGENGFIVDDLNEKIFMERTLFLANNEQERLKMAKKAKESVKRFDVNNIAKQWIKLFECKLPRN